MIAQAYVSPLWKRTVSTLEERCVCRILNPLFTGQKVFLGGDYDGDLCLYNIGNGKTSRTLKDGSKEIFDPEKVSLLLLDTRYSTLCFL